MKFISKKTSATKLQQRIRAASSVQHWLVSLSLHAVFILVLVSSTFVPGALHTPSRTIQVNYSMLIEQESQKKPTLFHDTMDRAPQSQHAPAKGIVSTNKTLSDDEVYEANLETTAVNVPANSTSPKHKNQADEQSAKLSSKTLTHISQKFEPLLVDKKKENSVSGLMQANVGQTEFSKRVEGRDAGFDPKSSIVNVGVSNVLRELLQGNSRKNNSKPNTRGPASSCSVKTLERQAPLSDKIPPRQRYELGPNQAIRISDLVGHGRYLRPSTSVRVSDLLNVGSQQKQLRQPNVSVTVGDLLRQHGPGFQSLCQ